MERYEYKVIDYDLVKPVVEFDQESKEDKRKAFERCEAWLNSHGEEGWELVCKGEGALIFKRVKSG